MTEQTLMRLLDAGFDKSEIMSLAGLPASTQTEQTQAVVPVVPTVPTPEPKQVENDAAVIPEAQTTNTVTMSDAQFTQLMQQLNNNNASIDVPPKHDIKNVLGEHFKDLMIGG